MPYDTAPMPEMDRVPLRAAVIELMSRAGRDPSAGPREMRAALRDILGRRPAADALWLAYRGRRPDRLGRIYAERCY